jgi:hypothetical protein
MSAAIRGRHYDLLRLTVLLPYDLQFIHAIIIS